MRRCIFRLPNYITGEDKNNPKTAKNIIAMKNSLFLAILLVALAGCRPALTSSPYAAAVSAVESNDLKAAEPGFLLAIALDDHPAEAHLQLGTLCENDTAQLPCAIWHFQRAGELADEESMRRQAQMHRERAEKAYLEILEETWASADILDRKLQVQLLKEQNHRLNDWVTRLNRENSTLRMMLSERQ